MGLIEMEYLGALTGSRTSIRMEQALAACSRARDLVKQILTFSSQGGNNDTRCASVRWSRMPCGC